MTAPDRAERIAALRTVLAIAEAHPEIPLPDIATYSSSAIFWSLRGDHAARHMAVLEEALPCGLTVHIERRAVSSDDRYELKGTIGGYTVTVSAPAPVVAEKRVIGTRQVEDIDWARKPVPADEPQGPAAGEGGQ